MTGNHNDNNGSSKQDKAVLKTAAPITPGEPQISENAMVVLNKRYLLKDAQGKVIETPEGMFRRVAKALAAVDRMYDPKADLKATEDEFYRSMASLEFVPNSPTLMNAGTEAGTLSACFVIGLDDSMEGIMDTAKQAAMVQKYGGGTGFALSGIRPKGSPIATTHGRACGPIAVLRHLSSVSNLVTQGGRRDGANMAVMDVHHPDILEFIDCKRVEGQIHNFNVSVGVDEEFMRAVEEGGELELRDPYTGQVARNIDAREVFDKIIAGAWLNGEPGLIFLDQVNRDNPTLNIGRMTATNPCGEQPLLPYESCNLGSINLARYITWKGDKGEVDYPRLGKMVATNAHMLDNVIDANRYSIPEIERMTKLTRKIGLGVMGFADLLVQLRVPYDSEEGLELGRDIMRFIRQEADGASEGLAQDRDVFPAFQGSKYDAPGMPRMRNACRLTVAPTGTISMIAGCSSGIEPLFALSYHKHNILEGQSLIYVNEDFERVARDEGFYSQELMEYLADGGSLQDRAEIPEWVKRVFVTASDIAPEWHVRMQAAFQESVDAGISKTINFPNSATLEDVRTAYVMAWELGCKGITVYRAGSREAEVLTAGSAEVQREAPEEETQRLLVPRQRPATVKGVTERVRTGHGNLYITINFDEEDRPFEVFTTLGKAGSCDSGQLEAISRLISMALRSGIDPITIVDQLRGITCHPVWDNGVQIRSNPDAVAQALARNLPESSRRTLVTAGHEELAQSREGAQLGMFTPAAQNGHQSASGVRCPDCGGFLIHQEGCLRCADCGYNRCE